jgi:hypothetical protein
VLSGVPRRAVRNAKQLAKHLRLVNVLLNLFATKMRRESSLLQKICHIVVRNGFVERAITAI